MDISKSHKETRPLNGTISIVARASLILCFLLIGFYAQAEKRTIEPLCPGDEGRQKNGAAYANINNTRINAPQTIEETRQALNSLSQPDSRLRNTAITALAQAGNLDAFNQLLQKKDRDGLYIYSLYYRNSDRSRCLAPQIEQALIEHHHAPWMQRTLQGFFQKNLYRDRRLYQALLNVAYDPQQPAKYRYYVLALTASNLPGIEAEILTKARGMLAHATAKQKNDLPYIHQTFIKYFSRRAYLPALSYINAVFQAEPRDEKRDHFRSQYLATRNHAYLELVRMPSPDTNALYLSELEQLSAQPWDAHFNSELSVLLKSAIQVDTGKEFQSALIGQIVRILQTPSLPGEAGYVDRRQDKNGDPAYFDFLIRKDVYRHLANIGSVLAANTLLHEWQRINSNPVKQNRDALNVSMIDIFLSFPHPQNVDSERLLRLVNELPDDTRGSYLLSFTRRYQHPNNSSLLLAQLDQHFQTDDKAHQIVGDQTVKLLINDLMLMNDKDVDASLRNRLDKYYELGRLPEDRYLGYVKILNERIGNESRVYQAIVAERKRQQEIRDREAKQRYREQLKQQAKLEYEQNSSPERIQVHIKSLSRSRKDAKRAAFWLVRVGPKALPYVHKTLQDPASDERLKIQLMNVLGEIGDVSSSGPIINSVRGLQDDSLLYHHALLALSFIPQTDEARQFADRVLASNKPVKLQQRALIYFALHRDKQAARWAEKFNRPEVAIELRNAGIYLAARLNMPGTQSMIVRELKTDNDRARRSILLRALVEVSDTDEFKKITADNHITQNNSHEYVKYLQAVQFRNAKGQEKSRMAAALLKGQDRIYQREVISYLIRTEKSDVLSMSLGLIPESGLPPDLILQFSPLAPLILSEARRQGYQLEATENGLVLRKSTQ